MTTPSPGFKTTEMRIHTTGVWGFAPIRAKPTSQWAILYQGQCCGTLDQQKDGWWDVFLEGWPVRSFRTFREAGAAVAGEETGDALSKKCLQA